MNYKDAQDVVEEGNASRMVRQNKGATAKILVLDMNENTGFWARCAEHVRVTVPIFKLLRRCAVAVANKCSPPP